MFKCLHYLYSLRTCGLWCWQVYWEMQRLGAQDKFPMRTIKYILPYLNHCTSTSTAESINLVLQMSFTNLQKSPIQIVVEMNVLWSHLSDSFWAEPSLSVVAFPDIMLGHEDFTLHVSEGSSPPLGLSSLSPLSTFSGFDTNMTSHASPRMSCIFNALPPPWISFVLCFLLSLI